MKYFTFLILLSCHLSSYSQFHSTGLFYLPDGSGINYTDTIFIAGFSPSQNITSISDMDSIYTNIEHSYLGDLEMTLTCPNGTSINIFNSYTGNGLAPGGFGGGSTYLGNAYDNNLGNPGVGMKYCWSSTYNTWGDFAAEHGLGNFIPVVSPSIGDAMNPNGIYQPEESFSNLIGCPLNGTWILTIRDNVGTDDGFVFGWGMHFNAGIAGSLPNADFSYSNSSIVGPDTICYGDTTFFINQSSNATSYLWDFGDGDTSLTQNPSHFFQNGNYTVQLIANNPFGSDTVYHWLNVVDPLPASISGLDSILCDTVVGLNGLPSGGTFTGGGIVGNNFSTFDSGLGSHTIQYYMNGNNVCYLATQTVYVTDNCISVGIEELNRNNINIYPNPTTEKLRISLAESKTGSLSIKNSIGQIILQETFTNTNQIDINLNDPSGIYFLQLETDGELITKKIIKQ